MKHILIAGVALLAMAMVAPYTAADAAGAAAAKDAAAFGAKTSPAFMTPIVRELASDAHLGRAPGNPAEMRTIEYLVQQFEALGLEPAGGTVNGKTSFIQDVPIVRTLVKDGLIKVNGAELVRNTDYYVTTQRSAPRIDVHNVDMVFVGYGVTAPEVGWDDFKDVDVKGKLVVMLINDPDFRAGEGDGAKGKFGDNRMTYYGRWTYKYEEAVRRGAAGALIIHDTAGAAYGWPTVIAGGGRNYDMATASVDQRLAVQGWISDGYARKLFADAGLDFEAELKAARQSDFRPKDLKANAHVHFNVEAEHLVSRNVVAKISGTKRPQESVMFGAHWDAYGEGPADAQGRTIRPGANDDALGVAAVIDVARQFKLGPKPERSVVFGLWTGEENGLLGSGYYAQNPDLPNSKLVAYFGYDVLQTAGLSKDVQLVGYGQNNLDDDFKAAIAAQGRRVTPETYSERGLNYRADHFAFGRLGVPTLLLMHMSGPHDLVNGGLEAGQAWLDGYMKCYHQTCDEWLPSWDLSGAAQDIDATVKIGRDLANSTRWPSWNAGSEFYAAQKNLRAN